MRRILLCLAAILVTSFCIWLPSFAGELDAGADTLVVESTDKCPAVVGPNPPAGCPVRRPLLIEIDASTEGNVYQCIRQPGYEYPVCKKIGTTAEPTPRVDPAETLAATQAALFVLPVRVNRVGFPGDGDAPVELCSSTTHGGSGCCRITATLEDGDVIIECGTR